jgi:hypothetical protein
MARTPLQWHSDELAHYIRPSTAACDFAGWEVREGTKGPVIWTPSSQGSVNLTATTVVRQQPSRWNDDPRAQPTMALDATPELTAFVQQLEEWALPKITGREEPRSALRTNVFAETFLRTKVAPVTRWFDKDGKLLTTVPDIPVGTSVCVLLSVSAYRMNGLKGLTIRALAVQPIYNCYVKKKSPQAS